MFSIGFIVIAIIILVAILILFSFVPVGLWISAIAAGVKVGIGTLIGMRLRRVSPRKVIAPLIKAHKAGLNLTTNQLESHYLAGGNVDRVVDANIAAQRADINLPFERGAAIDLAGRDVLQAVQMSVNPKVIETPFITGVAMNGIEVRAKARITVRANISRLVGGAGEETIIARVGEGIDSGTAFEILSIDIADVDIGKNIGADLQTEQALADKNIAQAKAEERRAMAVAKEQEMKASVQEMRAKVVEAESEVPLAMAEALRNGNLGVKDYYNLKNIEADTGMRNAINKHTDKEDPESPK